VDLRDLKRFVVWRYTWKSKEAKWDKPPLQFNGAPAKANDPTTWCGFDLAVAVCQRRGYDGIGFVPTEEDELVLLDLDHVVNADGTLTTWSPELRAMFRGDVPEPAALIAALGTYAEISPSGTGVRIICRGKLPDGRRKIGGKGNGCPDGLEMYSAAHYCTLTGQQLPDAPAVLCDCTEKLAALHLAVFGPPAAAIPAGIVPLPATFLGDMAVIEKAMGSKGGDKFRKLWGGDPSDYASRSEADFALAGRLAFFCGPNPGQIERLMRQSGLVRPKWDRRHYLEKTIGIRSRR
jgi:primase-polymerase (primpol)-like protein